MDEFQSFNLRNVDAIKQSQNDKVDFESNLGDFTWFQHQFIVLIRKPIIILLLVALIASFIVSAIANIEVLLSSDIGTESIIQFSAILRKVIAVFAIGLEAMLPIGVALVFVAGKRLDKTQLASGLEWIHSFLIINMILLFIAAFLIALGFLMLLFRAFLWVILFAVITGGILYFTYSLLKAADELVLDIKFTINERVDAEVPSIYPLKTLIIWFFIIVSLVQLFLLGYSLMSSDYVTDLSLSVSSTWIAIASFVTTLFQYGIILKILSLFESMMRESSKYLIVKKKQKTIHVYDGYYDMFGPEK